MPSDFMSVTVTGIHFSGLGGSALDSVMTFWGSHTE